MFGEHSQDVRFWSPRPGLCPNLQGTFKKLSETKRTEPIKHRIKTICSLLTANYKFSVFRKINIRRMSAERQNVLNCLIVLVSFRRRSPDIWKLNFLVERCFRTLQRTFTNFSETKTEQIKHHIL